jgi:soluble lytic murein transglycosylase-like protein
MLDPRANVQYAARFLKELRGRQGSWTMAVARYHAGPNNDPAQKRYVCTVIRNMVASGFGNWTKIQSILRRLNEKECIFSGCDPDI